MFSFTEYSVTPEKCILWRFGFNHAEKEIILFADGKYNDIVGKSCRKDVFRLLKDDLEKTFEKEELEDICSYLMKTTMLHLYERLPRPEAWIHSALRDRYVDALKSLLTCFKEKYMEHYFIKGQNLLDKLHLPQEEKSQQQLSVFLNKLERTLSKYQVEN